MEDEQIREFMNRAYLISDGNSVWNQSLGISLGLGAFVAAASWVICGHVQRKTFAGVVMAIDH